MAKDDELYIEASLNIKKSLSNIKNDIKTINEKLNDTKTGQAKITAGLNISDSRKLIQQQLNQVASKLKLRVNIDTATLKKVGISSQFKDIQNLGNTTVQSFSRIEQAAQSASNEIKGLIREEEKFNTKREFIGKTKTYQTGLGQTRKINFSAKGEETSSVIVTNLKQANKFQEQLNEKSAEYIRKIQAAHEINKDTNSSRSVSSEENVQQLNAQYDKVIKRVEQYKNSTLETSSQNKIALEDEIKRYETLAVKLKNAEKITQNLKPVNIESAKVDLLNRISSFLAEIDLQTQKTGSDFSGLKQKALSLKNELNDVTTSTDLKTATEKLSNLKTELTSSQKQSQILANSLNLETDKQKLSNRITQWLNENTKAGKRLRSEMEALQQKINDVDNGSDFNNLNKQFQQLDKYARATNQSGRGLLDTLKNNFGKLTNLLSIGNVVSQATSSIRDAINDLKDIDTILTEISKTSDKTDSELKQLGQDSFDTASKWGVKAKDYLSGVKEMSRSGYENAEQMAEVSTLAQSAGDMTSEMANKYLIATDAAYKYNGSIEKLTATLDGQNFITNHNSVSMTDLAEATSIVASQAANAGIAEDQLSAILGTMISKSKQSGSEMANAFKAILVNIQQIEGYTDEETGETFDEESFTKYEKAAEALGVSFKEMKNGVLSLRDPVTILEDLANAYNKLDPSDTKRANLLNSVGGKLRANALDVLLSNWDSYKKMLSEFSQGTGSAAEEGRKSAENWEGSLNRLSNTWDKFVSGFVDGDKATGVLTFFTKAIETVDFLTDHLGTLGTVLTSVMAYRGFKNEGRGKLKLTPLLNMPSLNYNNELMIA